MVPIVGPVSPRAHPLREGCDFGETLGRVLAPEDMHRRQGELSPGTAETGEVRRPGELPSRIFPSRWEHDLPDQSRRAGRGPSRRGRRVVHHCRPGPRQRPRRSPARQSRAVRAGTEGLGAPAGFLQGDDVEAGDDLGNARHGVPVPFLGSRGPAVHLVVRSPNARTCQVATSRLVPVLAGMIESRALEILSRSWVTAAGGAVGMAPSNHAHRCRLRCGGKPQIFISRSPTAISPFTVPFSTVAPDRRARWCRRSEAQANRARR